MSLHELKHCGYCDAPIAGGQRWVRQKVYDSRRDDQTAIYHHYHVEPFAQAASCWEKYQLARETARTAAEAVRL